MIFKDIFLVCDLDGTLLNNNRQVDKDNLEAIKYFTENGGSFTVATGRMETTIKDNFSTLQINKPGIFHNGALVYDINMCNYIFENSLDKSVKPIVSDLLETFDIGLEILTRKKIYIIKENLYTKGQQKREGFIPIYSDIFHVPFPWYKILIAGEHDILKKVRKWIEFRDKSLTTVFSEENLLDILAPNVSKGSALSFVRTLDKPKIVVAVGDGYNDINLLKEADFAVAVDNAKSQLKQIADLIIEDNNSCPIRELVYFLENTKEFKKIQKRLKTC